LLLKSAREVFVMRKVILSVVLAAATMAYAGCSTSGDGGGGGAGGDELKAISFNGETSVPATGASAISIDYGVGLASVISSMLSTIAVDADAQPPSASLKSFADLEDVPIPLCGPPPGEGTAILNVELVPLGASLTFTDCVGSPLSGGAINGKILLTNLLFSELTTTAIKATATADVTGLSEDEPFTIATGAAEDAVLDGEFAVEAAITLSDGGTGGAGGAGGAGGSGGSAGVVEVTELELVLGSSSVSIANRIEVEENGTPMLFACFEISTKIGTSPLSIEYFRPRGVLALDSQVFTLNGYAGDPESIGFDLSSGRAVPDSGTLRLLSGDSVNCLGGDVAGDGSHVTAAFRLEADDALVDIRAETSSGTVYKCTEEWENLLETLRDVTAFDSCPCIASCGTGGTGGSGGSGGTGGTGGDIECTFETLDLMMCIDDDIYMCTSTEGWQLFQDCELECMGSPGEVSCSTP